MLGVAWDPSEEFILTVSSDRSARFHSSASGRCAAPPLPPAAPREQISIRGLNREPQTIPWPLELRVAIRSHAYASGQRSADDGPGSFGS